MIPDYAKLDQAIAGALQDTRADLSGRPGYPQFAGQGLVNFQKGNLLEINTTLKTWGESVEYREQMFPAIMLEEPFSVDTPATGYMSATLRFILATATARDLKSSERDAETYVPILRPLAAAFLRNLSNQPGIISSSDRVQHRMTELRHYGSEPTAINSKQKFFEPIDAIILENVRVQLDNSFCH